MEVESVEPEEDAPVLFDINQLDPAKVNWFKYIIDTYERDPEDDDTPQILSSVDGYANLLQILMSS